MAGIVDLSEEDLIDLSVSNNDITVVVESNTDSIEVDADSYIEVDQSTVEVVELFDSRNPDPDFNPNNPFQNTDTPPAPTNLQASAGFSNVGLSWSPALYETHSYTEIWRHTADNINEATQVGSSSSSAYSDAVDPKATYFYWIRFVSLSGTIGPYNNIAGTTITTGTDISGMIAALEGQLQEDAFTQALLTKIDKIDVIDVGLDTEVVNRGIALADEVLARDSAIANAISVEIGEREASITGAVAIERDDRNAVVAQEQSVRFEADQVIASSVTVVQTQLNDIYLPEFDANYTYTVGEQFQYAGDFFTVILEQVPPNVPVPNPTYYDDHGEYLGPNSSIDVSSRAISGLDSRVSATEALASDTTLLNTSITVSADGTLNGAGGGQVTAAGIGAAEKTYVDTTFLALDDYSLDLSTIQAQVDGGITTWFYPGVPTLASVPATTWLDDATRDLHIGDLYYDDTPGFAYIFVKTGSVYSWEKLNNQDVLDALQNASTAQDTADGKRRVFVNQPTPPYDIGDLWDDGSGSLQRSAVDRAQGDVFNSNDWVDVVTADGIGASTKTYVDNTFLATATYNIDRATIQAQLDGSITTWFLTGVPTLINAPASDWTTNALKDQHVGDIYYDETPGFAYVFVENTGVYSWQKIEDADIIKALQDASDAQDTADNKRRVFVVEPTGPYDIGDLWDTGTGQIKRANANRASGYLASEWDIVITPEGIDTEGFLTGTSVAFSDLRSSVFVNGTGGLTSWAADTTLLNSQITMNPNGTLSGAGGGQVTAAGIGAVDVTTYGLDLADIQAQIDGSITTWFSNGAPTLANHPANTWNTDELKNVHLGDIYYDDDTGFAYRFKLVSTVYSWSRIVDSDITAALQAASDAQDTADGKRRVFVVTPIPPYDVGDLWDTGSGIKRSTVAKPSGSSFNNGDWILLADTTDYDDTRVSNSLGNFTGTISGSTASIVVANAENALNNAATANGLLSDIASDSKLTALEKQEVQREWDMIQAEKTLYDSQADALGITTEKTNYGTSYTTLSGYITPLLTSLTTTSDITGATFRNNFSDYYTKRQTLLNKIAAVASTLANWSSVFDDDGNKPEPNADVTATSAFVTVTYPDDINTLNSAISDGKLDTWYTGSDPSLTWLGDDSSHTGDMWWNTTTRKLKRWSGSAWSADIEDQKSIDAFNNASIAQDTADGKRRVFVVQPSGPYDIGDLWDTGSGLKRATADRASGYSAGEWGVASDITASSAFVTTLYPADQQAVADAISDGKLDTWYTGSDPSLSWAGTNASHTGDMWWNTSTNKLKRWSGTSWSADIEDQKAIDAYANAAIAQDTADGKRRVFVVQPSGPYDIGDLWDTGTGSIKRATADRVSGYSAGEWTEVVTPEGIDVEGFLTNNSTAFNQLSTDVSDNGQAISSAATSLLQLETSVSNGVNWFVDQYFQEKANSRPSLWSDHAQAVYSLSSGEGGTPAIEITANSTNIDVPYDILYPAKKDDVLHLRIRTKVQAAFNGSLKLTAEEFNSAKVTLGTVSGVTIPSADYTPRDTWDYIEATFTLTNASCAYVKLRLSVGSDATAGKVFISNAYVSSMPWDGNYSIVQQQAQSIDGIQAEYVIKTDVNGQVAGYGLINVAGAPSKFTMLVDDFSILHPNADDPTNPELAFGVRDGKTAIPAAYIVDLEAEQIALTTTGQIMGGQTSYGVGDGFFLGYEDNNYKFSLGNGTRYLRWDGTELDISAHLNAATGSFAGDISAATGTFSGDLNVQGGTITGAGIKGSLIEGSLIIGGEDLLGPTDADTGTDPRFFAFRDMVASTVVTGDSLTLGGYGGWVDLKSGDEYVKSSNEQKSTETYLGGTVYAGFYRWMVQDITPTLTFVYPGNSPYTVIGDALDDIYVRSIVQYEKYTETDVWTNIDTDDSGWVYSGPDWDGDRTKTTAVINGRTYTQRCRVNGASTPGTGCTGEGSSNNCQVTHIEIKLVSGSLLVSRSQRTRARVSVSVKSGTTLLTGNITSGTLTFADDQSKYLV